MGGLGNQLFQIFTMIACSLEQRIPFYLVENELGGSVRNCNGNIVLRHTYWNSFLKNLKPFIKQRRNVLAIQYAEQKFNFKEIPIFLKNNDILLFGYFQSYKYFNKHFKSILKLIKFNDLQTEMNKNTNYDYNNSISIHFRLGDYKYIQEHHNILNIEYYINSIAYIIKTTKKNDWDIIFFCEKDDINLVNENINIIKKKQDFNKINFICIDFNYEDYEQLIIMSLCKHNIIANSSFSWWGAYLNNNHDTITCKPNIWFGKNNSSNDTNDLCPSEWINIMH
jgi:hypothetical protein